MRSIMYHKKSILIIFIAICMLAPFIGALPVAHAADNTDDVQYEYIYLDLAAENISIKGSEYSGKVYHRDAEGNFTSVTVSGTLKDGQAYYVYQSQGGSDSPDGYFDKVSNTFVIPKRTPVTYEGKNWEDYITNNSDVEAVIGAWITAAPAAGRTSTPNNITITGQVNATLVIDNLWSAFQTGKNQSKADGGISFIPNADDAHLTIRAVGDNRFGNIFYANTRNRKKTNITFEEKEIGSSITVANLRKNDNRNYWCAAIGGNDSGTDWKENANGLIFNSGTIFAGTTAADDCTAIGGGGNGYGGITINGGRVTATVRSSGAAIGGGIGKTSRGGPADIVITGGEVYAYNFSCSSTYSLKGVSYIPAAAIGGGSSARSECDSCTVTITGGKVYAQSLGGTAIGGGSSSDTKGGNATVLISGNAYVEAKSIAGTIGNNQVPAGAAIGGGTGGNDSATTGGSVTLTIEGNPTVIVGSIGGGKTIHKDGNIGAATVTINGGTIQGQIVMQGINPTTKKPSSFTMTDGTIDNINANKDGFVFVEDNGGAVCVKSGTATISGGVIKNCINTDYLGGAIYLSGGNVNMTGGSIQDCKAQKGGAVYINGGNMTISGGAITQNTANENGGAVYINAGLLSVNGSADISNNKAINGAGAYLAGGSMTVEGNATIRANVASTDGGAAYLEGGSFTMSGGTMSGNTALNGAGALVANGSVTVSGGVITQNTATVNGGAFCISNGDYTMTGGELTYNLALTGDGGAIYVSSSQANTDITIRSGSITHNTAGKNGGALGVYGQDGVQFVITIGSCTNHKDCPAGYHKLMGDDTKTESCPIIQNNSSQTSGGAIYLAGSYDAVMNMYCLVEKDNRVGDGVSTSNFMMVDGGTLNITSLGPNGEADFGKMEINSSIHVTGGRVTLSGTHDNPIFNEHVTVDVAQGEGDIVGDFFNDLRTGGKGRVILYYENTPGSSRYVLIDEANPTSHRVIPNVYSRPGYDMGGWKLQSTNAIHAGGTIIYDTGNLIFHAVWEMLQYTIEFLPGVDDFEGPYDDRYQYFEYGKEQSLTPNRYTVFAYQFVVWHWVDAPEGTPEKDTIFKDGQAFIWPENSEITKITLVAQWVICDHNGTKYTFTITTSSAKRVCNCGAYTESLLLEAVNTVYQEGHQHVVDPVYQSISQNGYTPAPLWNGVTVSYSGTPNDNSSYGPTATAPINAGSYTVSITISYNDETHTISAPLFIDRAQRVPPPATPQYEVTVKTNGTDDPTDDINVIKITDTKADIPVEYLFSWYKDGVLNEGLGWITWTDIDNPPTQELSVAWTNYYVDVRYAQTDNYYPSQIIRGSQTVVWTGQVSIVIRSDSQNGLNHSRVDPYEKDGGEEGILVTLIPTSGYYIYNVDANITIIPKIDETDVSGYQHPTIESTSIGAEEWIVQIRNIADATSYGGLTIDILFSGAAKKVIVDSSVVKNEEFENVTAKGEDDVKISRDSAYTVCFDVKNYEHYSEPAILFSTAVPVGTTIIMVDYTDLSYWSYTVTSVVDQILLRDFIRMGTENIKFNCDDRESFTLQFVVDFSDCTTRIENVTLSTSFVATPVYPDALLGIASGVSVDNKIRNVPNVAITEEIQLVDEPTFAIGTQSDTGLTQSLSYQFAYSPIEGVGISKWDNTCGILVITPQNPEALPADARLQVRIGNSIKTYSLIDGKFTVALLSMGEGEVVITLLSGMLPNQNLTFAFDVQLYASATAVRTTPQGKLLSEMSLAYTVTKTIKPVIHVSFDGELPEYQGIDEAGVGVFTPFNFNVSLTEPIQEDWEIRAALYAKNADGVYTNTTQKGELTAKSSTEYAGTIGFNSFDQQMSQNKGSLSFMLKIEIVDKTGQVLNSVPLYFVLIDTRQ